MLNHVVMYHSWPLMASLIGDAWIIMLHWHIGLPAGFFYPQKSTYFCTKTRLVGGWTAPLKNMSSSVGITMGWWHSLHIWKNKKCSKPPTSYPSPYLMPSLRAFASKIRQTWDGHWTWFNPSNQRWSTYLATALWVSTNGPSTSNNFRFRWEVWAIPLEHH